MSFAMPIKLFQNDYCFVFSVDVRVDRDFVHVTVYWLDCVVTKEIEQREKTGFQLSRVTVAFSVVHNKHYSQLKKADAIKSQPKHFFFSFFLMKLKSWQNNTIYTDKWFGDLFFVCI